MIDVGINRTDDGLRGDVDFDRCRGARVLITPVPGGVGPMTIAMLLRNTVIAAGRSTCRPEDEPTASRPRKATAAARPRAPRGGSRSGIR